MRNYFVSQGGPDAAAGAHATKKWWNNLWEKRKKTRNFRKRIITCYNQPVEEDHFLGFGRFSFVSKSVCFCWGFVKVLLCFFCTLMHTQNEKWYALCIYIYIHIHTICIHIYIYIYINMMYSYISNIWNPLNFGPERTLSWMVNPGFSFASETGTIGQPERDVDLYIIVIIYICIAW